MIKEPLQFFFDKYNFYKSDIRKVIYGKVYLAVILNNGNIGLSANLDNVKKCLIPENDKINIENHQHRLILNAYYNAKLNYKPCCMSNNDLFEEINFKLYNNVVMIGYSKPMFNKLNSEVQNIHIFDYSKDDTFVIDQSLQKKNLKKTKCVILTATSIVNNTFTEIVNNTSSGCDIFVVGPSTPMTKEMFKYKNVKAIFGTIFNPNDEEVINIIKKGEGTRVFKHLGKKVAIKNGSL